MKKKRNKFKKFLRWKFILLTVLSVVFLFYVIRTFLLEAEVYLGIQDMLGNSLKEQIIEKADFEPPSNKLLNSRQIHVFLQMSERFKQLYEVQSSRAAYRKVIVHSLNHHSMTIGEYKWVRATVLETLQNPKYKLDSTGSANSLELSMVEQRLRAAFPALEAKVDKEVFN